MILNLFTGLLPVLVEFYIIMETTTVQAPCKNYKFQCKTGKCIDARLQCNGNYDCWDESDEENCENFTCTYPFIKCKSGHCFRESSRCDGYVNCRDKSDEFNCSECSSRAFACRRNGSESCISQKCVCDSVPDCPDGIDEVNDDCRHSSLVPDTLESNATENKINSSLVYVDDLIAFYHDGSVNKSTNWPLTLPHYLWAYAKKTYEPIDLDSRLFVIVERNSFQLYEGCSKFSTAESDWKDRKAILCITNSEFNYWHAKQTPQILESLLVSVGEFINPFERLLKVFPARCQPQMIDLISYDMYIYLQGYDSPQFLEWKTNQLQKLVRNTGMYCFRDWYLPIYEAYGGTEVLTNFGRLMSLYSKHKLLSYGPIFWNSGEFLHAWSGAVGTDLKYLYAKNTSGWTSRNERELKDAKKSYHLNYTHNSCHLAYIDQHVAVYFFSPGLYETSVIKSVSNAWKYVKDNYSPSTNQSTYTIILQYENITLNGTTCIPVYINRIPKKNQFVTFINHLTINLNVDKNVVLEKAIRSLVNLTLDLTQKTRSVQVVSSYSMTSIVLYDIYLELGLTDIANRWREIQLNTTVLGKFWFRDWYLKIYETHSQKVEILNSFLFLLNSTWDKKEGNLTKPLNVGEFVHFWSAAAGRNLLTDADNLFSWNRTLQNEFLQAREEFSNFNYSCTGCDNFRWKSYIDQKTPTRKTSLPIIIGVLVAVFVVPLIVVLTKLTLYINRTKKLNKTIRSLTQEELDEFLSGNLEASTNDLNAGILVVPYNTDFEISKERLVVDQYRVLGSGEFGFVFHAILRGDPENETVDMEVAVKTVKPNVEISYFKALLSEIKIMTHLGLHENIVSLLGTVTGKIANREVFIALELCPKGNLLHYLQRNRHRFQASWTQSVFTEFQTILNNESNPNDDETEITVNALSANSDNLLTLSTEELLEWSSQIANGMNYISSKNVIHGDLAARNVLLTFNNVAKISDFGLSRQLVKYSVYQKTSKTPIPWKWLAIETLTDKTFSVHSDVWSFGITLWEIFSLGKVPYPGKCWDKNFVNNLIAGERLESPDYGNTDIYNLMLNCWMKEPTERISFQEIFAALSELTEGMSTGISSSHRRGCTYTAL